MTDTDKQSERRKGKTKLVWNKEAQSIDTVRTDQPKSDINDEPYIGDQDCPHCGETQGYDGIYFCTNENCIDYKMRESEQPKSERYYHEKVSHGPWDILDRELDEYRDPIASTNSLAEAELICNALNSNGDNSELVEKITKRHDELYLLIQACGCGGECSVCSVVDQTMFTLSKCLTALNSNGDNSEFPGAIKDAELFMKRRQMTGELGMESSVIISNLLSVFKSTDNSELVGRIKDCREILTDCFEDQGSTKESLELCSVLDDCSTALSGKENESIDQTK